MSVRSVNLLMKLTNMHCCSGTSALSATEEKTGLSATNGRHSVYIHIYRSFSSPLLPPLFFWSFPRSTNISLTCPSVSDLKSVSVAASWRVYFVQMLFEGYFMISGLKHTHT